MNPVARAFGAMIRPFFNIGLGQIPFVWLIYRFVWHHLGPCGTKLVDVGDFQMHIDCQDWAVTPTLMFAHTWEPAETEICKRFIREGMTVIDAGAYIGYYSILASRLVGNKGRVYSFEPSPKSLGLLYQNIQLNRCGNVQVIEKAVADKIGQSTFYLSPQNPSGNTLFANYSAPSEKDPQITVLTTTLDAVVGDSKVDFIKMDIEGGETTALQGMTNIIRNNPNLKMIIEVFPKGLREVGSSLEELVDSLQRHFQLYLVREHGLTHEVGLPDIESETKKIAVINLFCYGKGN